MYRNFAGEYRPIIEAVSKTVLLNHGLEFSVEDYRTRRIEIRNYLRDRLKEKLETKYGIKLLDVYLGRIAFTSQINNLNLLRMLQGIYNEKASYDKQTNVTRAETWQLINKLKNEARYVVKSAQARAAHEVLKIEEVNRDIRLEMTHLAGLNGSLSQLSFIDARRQKADTQKAISFCYLSALINNDNVRFIQRTNNTGFYSDQDLDNQLDLSQKIKETYSFIEL